MDDWNTNSKNPKISFIGDLDLSLLEKDGRNSVVIIDDYMMADLNLRPTYLFADLDI